MDNKIRFKLTQISNENDNILIHLQTDLESDNNNYEFKLIIKLPLTAGTIGIATINILKKFLAVSVNHKIEIDWKGEILSSPPN